MSALPGRHDHRPRTATPPGHDDRHECIWVRRGICQPCRKTFTILPDWLAPSGHYSLRCRQQACERIAAGDTAEQAAPHCKDPSRLPDPSTVRRWAQRRLLSVWCWVQAGSCRRALFARHPPSLPGIWARSAVFCRSRQEVRESPGSRRVETADSAAGLSAGS